jgi:flagellar basal body-associated protein FliL
MSKGAILVVIVGLLGALVVLYLIFGKSGSASGQASSAQQAQTSTGTSVSLPVTLNNAFSTPKFSDVNNSYIYAPTSYKLNYDYTSSTTTNTSTTTNQESFVSNNVSSTSVKAGLFNF